MDQEILIGTKGEGGFTFLTNHFHVLLFISRESDVRMRDLATAIDITERAVQKIVDELRVSGYLDSVREGRRNHYTIHSEKLLRHPAVANQTVGALIAFMNKKHGHAHPAI